MVVRDSAPPQLRHAVRPADLESIRQIVAATGKFNAEEVSVAIELIEQRLSNGAASGYEFVVAERQLRDSAPVKSDLGNPAAHPKDVAESTQVVGFACYGKIPCTRSSYDLYWIAVDPAEQGRGIGRQLLSAVEDGLREVHATQLYVDTSGRADYADTRRYYESCGFEQAARLPDFYDVGDDKLIYRKLL